MLMVRMEEDHRVSGQGIETKTNVVAEVGKSKETRLFVSQISTSSLPHLPNRHGQTISQPVLCNCNKRRMLVERENIQPKKHTSRIQAV